MINKPGVCQEITKTGTDDLSKCSQLNEQQVRGVQRAAENKRPYFHSQHATACVLRHSIQERNKEGEIRGKGRRGRKFETEAKK